MRFYPPRHSLFASYNAFLSLLLIMVETGSLFGPLGELECSLQLDALVLELLDLGSSLALHIVDVLVDHGLHSLGRQVGPDQGLRGRVVAAVGVGTDHVRLNRLVLPIDEDLLIGGVWGVVNVMTTVHHDTIIVKLLNALDRCQAAGRLKVKLAHESGAHACERSCHGVAELQRCGSTLPELRIGQTSVDFARVHDSFASCRLDLNYNTLLLVA